MLRNIWSRWIRADRGRPFCAAYGRASRRCARAQGKAQFSGLHCRSGGRAYWPWRFGHRTIATRLCPECVGDPGVSTSHLRSWARRRTRRGILGGRQGAGRDYREADVRSRFFVFAIAWRSERKSRRQCSIVRERLSISIRMVLLRRRQMDFWLREIGRPFVRTIAARFDAYLATARGRHSVAV